MRHGRLSFLFFAAVLVWSGSCFGEMEPSPLGVDKDTPVTGKESQSTLEQENSYSLRPAETVPGSSSSSSSSSPSVLSRLLIRRAKRSLNYKDNSHYLTSQSSSYKKHRRRLHKRPESSEASSNSYVSSSSSSDLASDLGSSGHHHRPLPWERDFSSESPRRNAGGASGSGGGGGSGGSGGAGQLEEPQVAAVIGASQGLARNMMIRTPRAGRRYDVPQIGE